MYRIAIVDDNEAWCFVLAAALQQKGFAVSTFKDADTFLKATERFNLVFVDFSLPSRPFQVAMDGPDLICELKARLENPPVLILVSAFFTPISLEAAQEVCPQADGYLSKSVGVQGILAEVKRWVPAEARQSSGLQI